MHARIVRSYGGYVAAMLGSLFLSAAPLAQRAARAPGADAKVDAAVGAVLNAAIEALKAEKYADAESTISTLETGKLTPFELSRVEQIRFNIAFQEKRYGEAGEHLRKAIDAGGLRPDEVAQARYQMAQLLLAEQKWQQGAGALEDWFSTAVNPNPSAYYLLAVAYYQSGDYTHALPAVRRAVAESEQPPESWLVLLVSLDLRRSDYADAIQLLQQLLTIAPDNKKYWMQLSSAYGRIDDYRDALAIMQIAYNAGFLGEDAELRRFADLLVLNGLPRRGAQVLETAIDRKTVHPDGRVYAKLADSWIAAGELDKALPPLQRAAELATTGDLFVRLGEVQVQRGDWSAAGRALGSGIGKGRLTDSGQANYLMGVALLGAERFRDARGWFELALPTDKWREPSERYLKLIDSRLRPLVP